MEQPWQPFAARRASGSGWKWKATGDPISCLLYFPGNSTGRVDISVSILALKPQNSGVAHYTLVFSGRCHGQRGLAGYSPWGRKESGTAEHTYTGLLYLSCMLKDSSNKQGLIHHRGMSLQFYIFGEGMNLLAHLSDVRILSSKNGSFVSTF